MNSASANILTKVYKKYIIKIYLIYLNMKSILLKVNDKVIDELELIQKNEGLNNRTATILYLIKYYILTKENSLDQKIAIFDKLLEKIDWDKVPSLEEQLKDI